jgi:hypothetical protein
VATDEKTNRSSQILGRLDDFDVVSRAPDELPRLKCSRKKNKSSWQHGLQFGEGRVEKADMLSTSYFIHPSGRANMRVEADMTTIAILPENPGTRGTQYRAIAGEKQSIGRTAGEALDALTRQLDESQASTLVVVQQLRPDRFFTAQQQERLQELMEQWRRARDAETCLPPEEQAELDALVEQELRASAQRAAALVHQLAP